MNIQQDMGREQMRAAILKQEHIFRQQVHELHRLYHVQKQLMQQHQSQQAAAPSPAPAVIVDVKPKLPPQLDVWRGGEKATNSSQLISFASWGAAAAAPVAPPELAEECNLELTLATGVSSSSSNSCGGDAEGRGQRQRRRKASSNSESGATAVSSSTSTTESELAADQFRRREAVADVAPAAVRFHGESRTMMDKMGQGVWMYQCLSLKTA